MLILNSCPISGMSHKVNALKISLAASVCVCVCVWVKYINICTFMQCTHMQMCVYVRQCSKTFTLGGSRLWYTCSQSFNFSGRMNIFQINCGRKVVPPVANVLSLVSLSFLRLRCVTWFHCPSLSVSSDFSASGLPGPGSLRVSAVGVHPRLPVPHTS